MDKEQDWSIKTIAQKAVTTFFEPLVLLRNHITRGATAMTELAALHKALFQADSTGKISPETKQQFPGLHFCPDFDYDAVAPGVPEWRFCTCDKLKLFPQPKATPRPNQGPTFIDPSQYHAFIDPPENQDIPDPLPGDQGAAS